VKKYHEAKEHLEMLQLTEERMTQLTRFFQNADENRVIQALESGNSEHKEIVTNEVTCDQSSSLLMTLLILCKVFHYPSLMTSNRRVVDAVSSLVENLLSEGSPPVTETLPGVYLFVFHKSKVVSIWAKALAKRVPLTSEQQFDKLNPIFSWCISKR